MELDGREGLTQFYSEVFCERMDLKVVERRGGRSGFTGKLCLLFSAGKLRVRGATVDAMLAGTGHEGSLIKGRGRSPGNQTFLRGTLVEKKNM